MVSILLVALNYKKHLKNVGPIRHCELPHAHSPLSHARIDVHDNDDDNA